MSVQNFEIERGRTYDITVEVSGVGSWTDLLSKMYWRGNNRYGSPDVELDGVINDSANTIIYSITAAISSAIDAGSYKHEVVIYKADKIIVYAPLKGDVKVTTPIVEDPTL